MLYSRYHLFALPRLVACRSDEPRSGFAKPHSTVSRLPSRSLAASVSCGLGLLPCDSLCINSGADNSDRNCPVFKCLTLVSWPQISSQQVNRPYTIDRNGQFRQELSSSISRLSIKTASHQVPSGISMPSGQHATTHSTGQHI